MSALTVNDQLAEILTNVRNPTEVRDPRGKVIGIFHPTTVAEKKVNVGGARTTREVFEHLRTLTTDPERLADLDRHIEELKRRDDDA